jgi:hypothetical protein
LLPTALLVIPSEDHRKSYVEPDRFSLLHGISDRANICHLGHWRLRSHEDGS